jgi:branched-chain amino acid transport system permease protein
MNWRLAEQLLVDGVITGSFYALLGLSWNVIYATTRVFHFAHGLVFVAAAYAAVVLVGDRGVPLWLACIAGVAVGAALGGVIELGLYRSIRRAGGTGLTLFLASMGLFIAGTNLVQLAFGPQNRSLGEFPDRHFAFGSVAFSALDVAVVVVAWAALAGVLLWERRSRSGLALSAVRINPDMATSVGISVQRIYVLAFAVGSGLVSIGALYFTAKHVAQPTMGQAPIIAGLIAMFLGGIGSTTGAAVGGLVLGLSQSIGGLWLPGEYQTIVSFAILFLILLVRPQGLLGEALR